MVLGIQRGAGAYVGAPRGDTKVFATDTLIVYGRKEAIADLHQRRAGDEGDSGHRRAIDRETRRAIDRETRRAIDRETRRANS